MPRTIRCSLRHENRLLAKGFRAPAGVDEAGRGCLFGPVCAAAVILRPGADLTGIRDSKQVGEAERDRLASLVKASAVAWHVAFASVEEITELNILQASRLAMRRAVEGLDPQPDCLLVDFLTLDVPLVQENLVKGDALSKSIAAASLLAKTTRDQLIREWHDRYPQYGLRGNKGYGTPDHLQALREFGPTPLHRLSFAPLRQLTAAGAQGAR